MPHPEAPDGDRPPDGERVTFRRSDFVLMRRAARERWGVPGELQTEALFQAAKILTSRESGDREKLAAMRFLVAADRADLAGEVFKLKLLCKTPDDSAAAVDCRSALLDLAEADVRKKQGNV